MISLRARMIESGDITPGPIEKGFVAGPMLTLDATGRAAAERHIAEYHREPWKHANANWKPSPPPPVSRRREKR